MKMAEKGYHTMLRRKEVIRLHPITATLTMQMNDLYRCIYVERAKDTPNVHKLALYKSLLELVKLWRRKAVAYLRRPDVIDMDHKLVSMRQVLTDKEIAAYVRLLTSAKRGHGGSFVRLASLLAAPDLVRKQGITETQLRAQITVLLRHQNRKVLWEERISIEREAATEARLKLEALIAKHLRNTGVLKKPAATWLRFGKQYNHWEKLVSRKTLERLDWARYKNWRSMHSYKPKRGPAVQWTFTRKGEKR